MGMERMPTLISSNGVKFTYLSPRFLYAPYYFENERSTSGVYLKEMSILIGMTVNETFPLLFVRAF